jgi:hypothetical protein
MLQMFEYQIRESNMLSPQSFFRRIPTALSLSNRRLIGALVYAYDGADLSYKRMKEVAHAYSLPKERSETVESGWTPENRLAIVVDAWTCIDNLNRMRRLVTRFQYGDPRPDEVEKLLDALKPAQAIRNRIQHLDEDIFESKNCTEGHPVLGAITWIDSRVSEGRALFGVSSGPTIDAGKMLSRKIKSPTVIAEVGDFELMASDQTVNMDELINAAHLFMAKFERTLQSGISTTLRKAAEEKGVPLKQAGSYWPSDMVVAVRYRKDGQGWKTTSTDYFASVEVPLDSIDLLERTDT